MITFDYLTLKAFAKENEEFFAGARIQKIQQPSRRELILGIRKGSKAKKLYININPQFYHMCFISGMNEVKRNITIPDKPPMFCMLLRKYIENSTINCVKIPNYERIFEIYIDTYNELAEKIQLCLAVELMGKYSNIILYNTSTKKIIGCAHNVSEQKSSVREMSGTLPYVYPPQQDKLDVLEFEGIPNYDKLKDTFLGFSTQLQKECKHKTLDEIKDMFRLKKVSPNISYNYSEYSIFYKPESLMKLSVSDMIDDYYSYYIEQNNIKILKSDLLSIVNAKIKKLENSTLKIQYRLEQAKDAEKFRLYGDLLMANLFNLKDYSPLVEVFDYENNKNIRIFLDPQKSLKNNANDFYKLYNKSKKTLTHSIEMYERIKLELEYCEQLKYSIACSETFGEVYDIKLEIQPERQKPTQERKSYEPIRTQIDGYDVYIGKNNRQNDYIVSKLAKDDDLWLHVHNCAGSHVLLKCSNPQESTILACAKLAKKYSTASQSAKAGVIYTAAKNLKKPHKSPMGYVTYRGEKEIVVD